jgi:hypothetical protein
LTQALALEGLAWIAISAFVAGIVRGFAGFGTAMIYLMASPHGPTVIRANTSAYLFFYDILLVVVLLILGRFDPAPFVLGLMLSIPAMAGNLLGGWLFHPRYERLYRGVAYLIIASAAVSGLPFLSGGG